MVNLNRLKSYLGKAQDAIERGENPTSFLIEALHIKKKIGADRELFGIDPKDLATLLEVSKESLVEQKYIFGNSSVTVSPGRGGTITSLNLGGTEIFYDDPERRLNPKQSLRESFWMLPQSGPFSPEKGEELGYNLKQHGFGRNQEWKPEESSDGPIIERDGNTIFMGLHSNEETMKQYPADFECYQAISIKDREKNAHFTIEIGNSSKDTLWAPGKHNYYRVPNEQKENIMLSSNMGVTDEMKKQRINGKKAIKISNPGMCQVSIPGIGDLELSFELNFGYLRLWSEEGSDFVCIEPVVCHPSEWPEEAIKIPAGESLEIGYSIRLLDSTSHKDISLSL